MTTANHKPVETPGNRPCSACSRSMSENAKYWFGENQIRVICTPCFVSGYEFDPLGVAVYITPEEALRRFRVAQQQDKATRRRTRPRAEQQPQTPL